MIEFSHEDKPRNTEPTQKEQKGNKTALIIIIIILSIVLIAVGYYFISENQQLELERDDKVAELVMAYDQLDSIGVELDERIEEILRLGGDVEDLLVVQEELRAEKEKILKTKNVQIQDLRDRVAGYTFLLKEKDKQIVKLRALNQELLSENTELKVERNELSQSITQLNQSKEKLEEKVAVASQLTAENIIITAINRRGKEKEGEFKNRQVDKLRVEFNLADNQVAPIGGKEILIRITDPQGNSLFDIATGSGTFIFNGKEEFYTAKQEILFDNSQQKLSFIYHKGSPYGVGEHIMTVYAEGYEIGSKRFTVK